MNASGPGGRQNGSKALQPEPVNPDAVTEILFARQSLCEGDLWLPRKHLVYQRINTRITIRRHSFLSFGFQF